MKDIDIDNTIENTGCEKKEQLRAQLHTRIGLPQQDEEQIKSTRRGFRLKAVALGIAAMCAVCLAIVLPISLRNNAPTLSNNRYTYSVDDCLADNMGLTIKEYSEQTGKNILYIDWYDIAEECLTKKYFLPDKEDEIIYITEDLLNGETGDHVRLSIVSTNTSIDELDTFRDFCTLNYKFNGIIIYWVYNFDISRAYFEYSGYKYYLRLDYPMSEQSILDIVIDMF